jgi:Ca2+-binding RTX toxin-like protein
MFLDLNNVEFAFIIGPSHLEGGLGSNIVIAVGSDQYIEFGPEDDTIHGGEGNDTVGSHGGNDIVTGGDDSYTLMGGVGNDTVSGDAGDDTVVFSGNFADYHISYDHNAAAYTIMDTVAGRDGTDIVSTVEHFRFLDGTKTYILVPQLLSATPAD